MLLTNVTIKKKGHENDSMKGNTHLSKILIF